MLKSTTIIFLDSQHEAFYENNIVKTGSYNDPYRKALFYTLGLTEETRRNIKSLYDNESRCIEFSGLFAGWQTGTSKKVTRLAFNLYSGFLGETGEEETDSTEGYTPYYLFSCGLMPYMFEAIKLRYPEYANDFR